MRMLSKNFSRVHFKISFLFLCPASDDVGAYSFLFFSVHGYMCMNVRPSLLICVHTYVHDPVRLGLRHLNKPTDLDLHCLPLSM